MINSLSSSFLIFIQHLTWDHLALKNYFHLTSETHYFPGFIPRQLSISLWFYFSGFSVLGGSRSVSSSKNALYMHFLFPSRAWLLNHLYCDGSQNDISSPKCSHEFRIGNLITSLTSPFGCPIGISNQSNKNKFFFFFPSCLLRYGFQIQKCYPYLPSVCACSVSSSLWPHGLQPTRLLCPWNSPGKKTGVGCHFLFQGIFLTQGLNLCLCVSFISCFDRQILLPLSPLGSSNVLKKVLVKFSYAYCLSALLDYCKLMHHSSYLVPF